MQIRTVADQAVGGGQETWNLCGHLYGREEHLFMTNFYRTKRAMAPLPPPPPDLLLQMAKHSCRQQYIPVGCILTSSMAAWGECTPPIHTPLSTHTPAHTTPVHTPLPKCMLGYTPFCPIACWNTHPSAQVHAGMHTPFSSSACWDTPHDRQTWRKHYLGFTIDKTVTLNFSLFASNGRAVGWSI